MQDCVLVLDFGSQYTQLIARRVREQGVYSEIRPYNQKPEELDLTHIRAVILSGGPASVAEEGAPQLDPQWLEIEKPILGICYGMQLLSHSHGAQLTSGERGEYGHASLEIMENESLFYGFEPGALTPVWMSHGDHIESAPPGFEVLARSQGAPVAAIGNNEKKIFALQFHPEVVHTARGKEILANFLFSISGCEKNWTADDFIDSTIHGVAEEVPADANVICGLSGGVDSTVAAVLLGKALGQRLHCLFVDNGLLRKNEVDEVVKNLGPQGLGLRIHVVDAAKQFLSALRGVTDPEKKRKIIGHVFIDVFEEEAKRIENVTHLVQGTLYPDVIESISVGGPSSTIKTHHNVGGLPERMNLKLIEPFRELFKDEVRDVGRKLGIAEDLIQRHPFPGPGLAVRILDEITERHLQTLRHADQIFVEEIRAEGVYSQLWQGFAVLLPVQSVGVMGDSRTYDQTIALRAVTSEDGMTADWTYLPHELLSRVSNRIINEVKGVNRVVLDISSKPPATIEWE